MSTLLLALLACTDIVHTIGPVYELPDGGGDDDTDAPAAVEPPLTANTAPDALDVSVYGDDGNVWWIGAAADQIEAMNDAYDGDGGWGGGGVYTPGGGADGTYADTLLLATPDGACADFGMTDVKLVGQSTGTTWSASTIPNFRLNSDTYTDGLRYGGVEHVRLNSAQVGSMFGEASALLVFEALGVPAARSSYAWVAGTGWEDPTLLVPMIAREMYKGDFCERNADLLGGGCVNVREGLGDIDVSGAWGNFECDYGDCSDESRLDALADAISANRGTESFDEATADYLDWDAFRRSSCVHWLLWVGDDYVHNTNNVVLAEGADGRFRLLPYSTDITAGYAWGGSYSDIPLWGWASLSAGCQADAGCREAMYDTCDAVIDEFEALDPPSVIDGLAARLRGTPAPWGDAYPNGMWRGPDDDAYEHFRAFYASRVENARAELAALREGGGDTGDTGWDTGPVDTGPVDTGIIFEDDRTERVAGQ